MDKDKDKSPTGPAKRGRPTTDPKPMASFTFELPREQHTTGSDKSMQGRMFNLSLYLRLLHKEFCEQPLEESQAQLRALLEKYGDASHNNGAGREKRK